jgi:hypothetical protein
VRPGVDETVDRVFTADSGGLIAYAAVLALWQVSGVVRGCIGAFTRI